MFNAMFWFGIWFFDYDFKDNFARPVSHKLQHKMCVCVCAFVLRDTELFPNCIRLIDFIHHLNAPMIIRANNNNAAAASNLPRKIHGKVTWLKPNMAGCKRSLLCRDFVSIWPKLVTLWARMNRSFNNNGSIFSSIFCTIFHVICAAHWVSFSLFLCESVCSFVDVHQKITKNRRKLRNIRCDST